MKVRIAIVLIMLFVTGIVMTISGISNLIKLNGDIPDFNYESMQDIKKGDFVQGYVWNIDGCYAYTTTTNTKYGVELNSYTSDEYFAMPLINDKDLEADLYITIVASKQSDRDLLYDINDATWEYYEGNLDVEFPEMGIVAKVGKLDAEYEQYFVEAMMDAEYYSSAAEARSHILPYTLTIYNTSAPYTSLGIGLLIVAVFVVVGIIVYTKYKKDNEPQTFIPAAEPSMGNFTAANTSSENGFAESYTPPQPVPMPNLTQPTDADEFFARAPKPAAPAAQEVPKEEPAVPVAPAAPAAPSEPVLGDMDALDTTGLFDDADYEIDENPDDSDFIE